MHLHPDGENKDHIHGLWINTLIAIALSLATAMFALAVCVAVLGISIQMNRTTVRRLEALEGLVKIYQDRETGASMKSQDTDLLPLAVPSTYNDPRTRISFTVPAGWTVSTDEEGNTTVVR